MRGELGHQIYLLGPYGEGRKQKEEGKGLRSQTQRGQGGWRGCGGDWRGREREKKSGRKSQGREQREVIEENKQAWWGKRRAKGREGEARAASSLCSGGRESREGPSVRNELETKNLGSSRD